MRLSGFIDHALRKPHSAAIVAAVGALAAVAVTTLVFGKYELLPNVVFAAMLAGLGSWTVHTWRRLWRLGNGPWEQFVFKGVRFGLVIWILFVISIPPFIASESQHSWSAFVAVTTFLLFYLRLVYSPNLAVEWLLLGTDDGGIARYQETSIKEQPGLISKVRCREVPGLQVTPC